LRANAESLAASFAEANANFRANLGLDATPAAPETIAPRWPAQ
jgi:hypothetical protein